MKPMNEQELRIGNYVIYEGSIEKIQCGEQIDCNRGETIKPIPLTEQWLLDFGYEYWEKIQTNEYESFKRYVIYNFLGTSNHEVHIITSTYGNTNHVEYVTSIDKDERQYSGRMEFVHDLQNAVHKETFLELTLNNN